MCKVDVALSVCGDVGDESMVCLVLLHEIPRFLIAQTHLKKKIVTFPPYFAVC